MTPWVPALFAVLAASTAFGAETYAIVDVDSPDTLVGLAAQMTRVAVEAATTMKLNVITPEQLRTKLDDKQYADLRKCGGSPACVSQFSAQLAAKKVVLGSLSRDEKNYLVKWWLIDLDKVSVVADVDRQVLIAARRFQRDIEQAVPPLLRGEREARGSLNITSNVANAQVTLNGDFVGATPIELPLKPGKYEVKVEKKKYLSVTRLVNVEANQKTEAEMKLLLMPGEMPDEPLDATAKKTGGGGESHPVHLTVPTWVAGGATVVSVGLALYFGLTARAQDNTLLDGYDAAKGTYRGTRKDALTVQQNALAANICFGVAGAAAVATAVFLILDVVNSNSSGSTPAVTVSGVAGPSGGHVFVGGHF